MSNRPRWMKKQTKTFAVKKPTIDVMIPKNRPIQANHQVTLEARPESDPTMKIMCSCGQSFEGKKVFRENIERAAFDHAMPIREDVT